MQNRNRTGGQVSLNPRDQAMVDAQTDPRQRELIACALAQYRRPDRLQAGDAVPPLELLRLDSAGSIRLGAFVGDRPLALVFGSYT